MVSALLLLLVASATVLGCGSDYVPVVGGYSGGTVGGGATDAGFDFDAQFGKPPGCGVGPDGGVCDCLDVPLLGEPPNFYFVLDRSGSMRTDDKWDKVRVAVSEIMKAIGPRARFGATVFPGAEDACSPGVEVMSVRPGDSPAGSFGPTTRFLVEVTRAFAPVGGTPTAATLQALEPRLSRLQGKTYVILATDGGPNCGAQPCGADRCLSNIESLNGCSPTTASCCDREVRNCLDGDAMVSAVTTLKRASVPTYVIGVPGSRPYAELLERVARAAGTEQPGSPGYYRVDTADKAELVTALRKVAAKIVATCTFELRAPPENPNRVNVYLDEVVLPKDPTNGWTLEGKTVTLVGAACERVMSGDIFDVRIIAGCPTVETR